ncbi:NifU-like protein [Ceratocystis lukuohia]|uniref:NifU-like protein n=1 Tax=Ceratocystis lukuohia TaxID=2019550 RepID=A0ABR4MRB4_9PEZI
MSLQSSARAASLLRASSRVTVRSTHSKVSCAAFRSSSASTRYSSAWSPSRPNILSQFNSAAIGSLRTGRLSGVLVSGARTIFIQTEPTPNADAIKFVPNHTIIPEKLNRSSIEYLSPRSTISPPYTSPLAAQLMNIDGVESVFYGQDFITVTKATDANWSFIRPEIFALITEAVTSGQEIVHVADRKEGEPVPEEEVDSLAYDESDTEVVGMIKELLETRIRPAIQEDGGDIEFRGFSEGDGMVKLMLKGACRTCDSSTETLKNGIESMLMHYIEEVKGVMQVVDPEEEIAIKEFEKFEEKLKQQQERQATA